MRVLQVNNYGYVRGGSERMFIDTSTLLEKNGHQVDYLVPQDARNLVAPCCEFTGINVAAPGIRDVPSFLYSRDSRKALHEYLRRFKPDIVHLHIYYGQITSSILGLLKDFGVPVVQTLHEYKLQCPVSTSYRQAAYCDECSRERYWNCIKHRCNRGSFTRSAIVSMESWISDFLGAKSEITQYMTVSEFQRQLLIKSGIQDDKLTTVSNFVVNEAFCDNSHPGSYFLYFGRVEMIKGLKTLIDAMGKITDIDLLVVGDGVDKPALQNYTNDCGVTNVRFLGFRSGEELRTLIAGAICVVAPSEWHETFGLVLIESFAQSRPVIASKMGGMTEIVSHGEDGLLFDAGDVKGLASALCWMADNRELAVEMGKRGQQKAREVYSESSYYERLMNVYRGVLSASDASNCR